MQINPANLGLFVQSAPVANTGNLDHGIKAETLQQVETQLRDRALSFDLETPDANGAKPAFAMSLAQPGEVKTIPYAGVFLCIVGFDAEGNPVPVDRDLFKTMDMNATSRWHQHLHKNHRALMRNSDPSQEIALPTTKANAFKIGIEDGDFLAYDLVEFHYKQGASQRNVELVMKAHPEDIGAKGKSLNGNSKADFSQLRQQFRNVMISGSRNAGDLIEEANALEPGSAGADDSHIWTPDMVSRGHPFTDCLTPETFGLAKVFAFGDMSSEDRHSGHDYPTQTFWADHIEVYYLDKVMNQEQKRRKSSSVKSRAFIVNGNLNPEHERVAGDEQAPQSATPAQSSKPAPKGNVLEARKKELENFSKYEKFLVMRKLKYRLGYKDDDKTKLEWMKTEWEKAGIHLSTDEVPAFVGSGKLEAIKGYLGKIMEDLVWKPSMERWEEIKREALNEARSPQPATQFDTAEETESTGAEEGLGEPPYEPEPAPEPSGESPGESPNEEDNPTIPVPGASAQSAAENLGGQGIFAQDNFASQPQSQPQSQDEEQANVGVVKPGERKQRKG